MNTNPARWIYNYRLTPAAIQIVVFGSLPVKTIPFDSIADLREVELKDTLKPDFSTLRLGNSFFGRIIRLELKSGLFKRILITPERPDEFIAAWKIERLRNYSKGDCRDSANLADCCPKTKK